MSSTWWIGIVAKSPLNKKQIEKFVKALFETCADVGYRKEWINTDAFNIFSCRSPLEHYGEEHFRLRFNKTPSQEELQELIQKNLEKDHIIEFDFTGGDKNEGFNGMLRINDIGEIVYVEIEFEDFVSESKANVKTILDISQAIYNALDAFYAYLTSEDDPEAKEGVIHTSEFKKVLENYEKGVVNSFNMKSFCEEVKRKDGTF